MVGTRLLLVAHKCSLLFPSKGEAVCLPFISICSCKHSSWNGIKTFEDDVCVSIALLMLHRVLSGSWGYILHSKVSFISQNSGSKYRLIWSHDLDPANYRLRSAHLHQLLTLDPVSSLLSLRNSCANFPQLGCSSLSEQSSC